MGAGKSTIGARLAKATGRRFVELDEEVAHAFGCSVPAVFDRWGEAAFRAMEARLLGQALAQGDRVVSLGGGAVLDPGNRRLLLERATWVHLDVSLGEVSRRLSRPEEAAQRPLWDPQRAAELLRDRAPAYAEAPHRVAAEGDPADIANSIRDLLGDAGGRLAQQRTGGASPRRIAVAVPGARYDVLLGHRILGEVATAVAAVGSGPLALLTDWEVGPLHADAVEAALVAAGREVVRVTLPSGEVRKDVRPVLDALDRLLDAGWQRSAPVVALGGGVLGDMAGLVAALCLRGVPFVQVPTTLLALVDSSVGGKVGVNHRSGKNLIGAFWQPALVAADLAFLDTLADRQLRAGFGEVVKTALLGDPELFAMLEADPDRYLRRDPGALMDAVARCVAVKAAIVAADAREAGVRRCLNLGHTFGHAVEAAAGYGRILHGEAVAIGLVASAELAARAGVGPTDLADRLRSLLTRLGLPTAAPDLPDSLLLRALSRDKKLQDTQVQWVYSTRPGEWAELRLPLSESPRWLTWLREASVLGSKEDCP